MKFCLLTKSEGGLQSLNHAELKWLETNATIALAMN